MNSKYQMEMARMLHSSLSIFQKVHGFFLKDLQKKSNLVVCKLKIAILGHGTRGHKWRQIKIY